VAAIRLIVVVIHVFNFNHQRIEIMKYALTIYPAVEAGNPSKRFMFETAAEVEAASNTCADLLLFMQDMAKVMDDYSNMFVIEQKINGEWVEIC